MTGCSGVATQPPDAPQPIAETDGADTEGAATADAGVLEVADDTDTASTAEAAALSFEDETPPGGELAALRETLRIPEPPPLRTTHLARFLSTLSGMASRSESHPVRILHFGDSHTAADVMPSTIRRMLQDRFGDGGRGFVFVGKPWPSYHLVDGFVDARGEWQTHRVLLSKRAEQLDGRYGLGGVAIESPQRGATATLGTSRKTAYCDTASVFDIFYLKQPGGGTFSVLVDGRRVGKVRTKSNRYKTGIKHLSLPKGPHQIDLRVKGDGKVRLFGASMEAEDGGISYDVLGINGAFFYTPLRWDGPVFRDQIHQRDPSLVIAMYGANEADTRKLTRKVYTRRVRRTLERFTQDAPNASCLVLGPMDRRLRRQPAMSKEKLDFIIDVQTEVADSLGCAFMDLRQLMGGPGSIEKWRRQGLAQGDYVHLTMAGYRALGKMVGERLLDAYDRFTAKTPSCSDNSDPDTSDRGKQ